VYNAEPYLAECIESVLAQTYGNWEYVIVNNCSKDRSLEIAQKYAQRDHRIRVHNNTEFLSQFQNWNHAMRQISTESKYCKVVHADDWLFPECIAQMVALAEAYPSVGIVSAYRLDEDRVTLDGLPYPSTAISGHVVCRAVLLGGLYVFGSPTSLLVRSDIIRTRMEFYDASILHADTAVCFDILQDHDFGFVHQVLSFTRRHNESVTSLTHKFNTRSLADISFLLKYGPIYLSDQEFEARRHRVLTSYHRYLARCVLERKDKAFWQYHRTEMKKLGHPISTARVAKAVLVSLLDVRQTTRVIRNGAKASEKSDAPSAGDWDNIVSTIVTRGDSDENNT
jgi:glycosyltransferase involved in cell wall biosynthesis